MERRRLILVACLIFGFASPGRATRATSPISGGSQDAVTRRESKRLNKTFGLVLPDSAKVTTVLKTPKSKVTYLLIHMSADDGRLFKERLNAGPSAGHPKIFPSVENAGCVEKDGILCTSIGRLNVPNDTPDVIIDRWNKDNKFETDTSASYRTKGFKKFASMFLDSKKGLLLLWYKT